MINPMDLSDRKILITGASNGIGKQIAISCAKQGAKIIIAARNEAKLSNLKKEIGELVLASYSIDLANIEKIEPFIKMVVDEYGPIDGLVHSAGISRNRPLSMYKYKNVHEIMLINFYAFIELIRVISKKGNYGQGTSIVGISSVASIRGNKSQTIYAASKAAMDGAMRCLAKELHTKNMRVNTVLPSLIQTEMFEGYSRKAGIGQEDILQKQYLGLGKPEDVANAVIFLLSHASRFVTGTQLVVDGGMTSAQ